jgi:hypothetical protein
MPKGRPRKVDQDGLRPRHIIPFDKPLPSEQRTPMRKLWELAHKHGIPIQDKWDRQELESKLADAGYEKPGPYCEDVKNYWQFLSRNPGNSPISCRDIEGNWSAEVNHDGSVILKHHHPVNLFNRVPGIRYSDDVITIPSLEEFAVRLMLLLEESDKIFDEATDRHKKDADALESQSATPSIHGGDVRIEQLNLLAEEFGYIGPNAVQLHRLPYKIAEAIGLELYDERGFEKNWNVMADEVIYESAIESTDARGPSYDRGPHEPPL